MLSCYTRNAAVFADRIRRRDVGTDPDATWHCPNQGNVRPNIRRMQPPFRPARNRKSTTAPTPSNSGRILLPRRVPQISSTASTAAEQGWVFTGNQQHRQISSRAPQSSVITWHPSWPAASVSATTAIGRRSRSTQFPGLLDSVFARLNHLRQSQIPPNVSDNSTPSSITTSNGSRDRCSAPSVLCRYLDFGRRTSCPCRFIVVPE